MAAILAISGIVIFGLYIATLHKNAVLTFISGAVYHWYKEHDESSMIESIVTQSLIAPRGFKTIKGLTGLSVIIWGVICALNGLWAFLVAIPVGFIIAILVIKVTAKSFNVRAAIQKASIVVAANADKYHAHRLTASDIANNAPKQQLSNLDYLLQSNDFIKFAQRFRRSQLQR